MHKASWLFALSLILPAAETQDYKDIKLPTAAEDLVRGKKLFDGSCQLCHGPLGDGGKGANLAQAKLPRSSTDGDLVRIIETGIPGTEMPGSWHMTRREVTQVAAYVRTFSKVVREKASGDVGLGREIYAGKGGCKSCHTLKNADGLYEGGLMGPDLASIGTRRSIKHLRESLIDPSASLPDSFVNTTVVLKSGKRFTGRLLTEETFTIAINDFSGTNHVFAKQNVGSLTKDRKKSPMPSYKDRLTASELDNLVAYLASLEESK